MKSMSEQQFFQLLSDVLHGDQEHRDWLTEAFNAAWEGKEVPSPRGSGTKDRLYREIHRLRDALEVIRNNPCTCECCERLKNL